MESYVDAHVHCGENELGRGYVYSFQNYLQEIKNTGIDAAVIFAPVGQIYERKGEFEDNILWRVKRKKANWQVAKYTSSEEIKVFPFNFVWNDFCLTSLSVYLGIKWHRHKNEPIYHYLSEGYKNFVEEIKKLNFRLF